jgi:glutamyl-tRNA reductase
MSVLVVGLSHKSAPLAVLERAAVTGDALTKLMHDVAGAEDVAGAMVVSTCNRVEVYAEVGKFHGGLNAVSEMLARHTGVPISELTPYLYVHYQGRAAAHLLSVACGLDSMVIGESQILGQVRQALRFARAQGTLSPALADLGALALRAGKRAQAETGIGRAGASLVSVGLAQAASALGACAGSRHALAGRSVLIVGAGSMSSLAVSAIGGMSPARVVVANRRKDRAERLAASIGATAAGLSGVSDYIVTADLVVTCTGAPGYILTAAAVADAMAYRDQGRPLVLLDLALPRDVDPDVTKLPGVTLVSLDTLAGAGEAAGKVSPVSGIAARAEDVDAVRRIVAEELAAQLSAERAAEVAPVVVALRARAAEVVAAEMARLERRLNGVDPRTHREIVRSLHRIADKLLHVPTVRVKELAGSPGADSYDAALRVLFDLDPGAPGSVTRAEVP